MSKPPLQTTTRSAAAAKIRALPPRRFPWGTLAALLAGLAMLAWPLALWLLDVPWETVLLGGLAAAFLLGCLARWRRVPLVGPLFYYELVRLARRGRTVLIRTVYALALLAVLWMAYGSLLGRGTNLHMLFAPGPALSPNTLARMGPQFVLAILTLQAAAVYILTPAYVAGAVAEEREKRTLELLFTTHLRDREIILGKLLARVAHIGGVLLAGLPVLCLVQFWGGVDPRMILLGFTATALPLLSVGSLSILCSAVHRSRTGALIASYACLAALSLCCFPFPGGYLSSSPAFLIELQQRLERGVTVPSFVGGAVVSPMLAGSPGTAGEIMAQMACEYASVHGLVSVLLLAWAVRVLRRGTEPPELPPELVTALRKEPAGTPAPTPPALPPFERGGRPFQLRPVGDDPLLWKEVECHFVQSAAYPLLLFAVTFIGLVAVMVLITSVGLFAEGPARRGFRPDFLEEVAHPLLRMMTVGLGLLACVTAGFRAAGAVSRERERHTLDGLLTLPLERRHILQAKWLGQVLGLQPLGWAAALVWGVGLLTGTLHPLAVVLLALEIGSVIALVVSVGLFLSVVCRSTLRAHFLMAVVLGVLFGGPWLALAYGPALFGGNWGPNRWSWGVLFGDVLNPLASWWYAGFSWGELSAGEVVLTLASSGVGTALAAGAAWVVWRFACRRFGRDAGAARPVRQP